MPDDQCIWTWLPGQVTIARMSYDQMAAVKKQSGAGTFTLHFEKAGASQDSHAVPAAVIAETLNGIQKIVHLTAMHCTDHEIRQRIPAHIGKRIMLMCYVPEKGSLEIPASVEESDNDLFTHLFVEEVETCLSDTIQAVSEGNREKYEETIYRGDFQKPILETLKKTNSGLKTDFRLFIYDGRKHNKIFDSTHIEQNIQNIQRREKERYQERSVVTGHIVQVNFEKKAVKIRHKGTDKILECKYLQEMETRMLDEPDKLIQIDCNAEMDSEGNVVRILEVTDILNLDLNPIRVDRVPLKTGFLVPHEPITVTPTLSSSGQFFCVEYTYLDIHLTDYTRKEIEESLVECFAFLWKSYALEDDKNMTAGAQEIKQQLLAMFKEKMQ